MLLDIQNAEIKISYEFKDNNTQGTLEDLTDDTIEILERNFSLGLGGAFYLGGALAVAFFCLGGAFFVWGCCCWLLP